MKIAEIPSSTEYLAPDNLAKVMARYEINILREKRYSYLAEIAFSLLGEDYSLARLDGVLVFYDNKRVALTLNYNDVSKNYTIQANSIDESEYITLDIY